MELVANFRHSTGPTKFVLPLKDSELESRQDIIYLLVYIIIIIHIPCKDACYALLVSIRVSLF